MAGAGKGGPGETRPAESGRRKRPGPPTIDLKATEIPAAETPADPPRADPTPGSEQATGGASAPPGWQDMVRDAVARHWPPPTPVVVGVIAIVLLIIAMWLAMYPQRPDPSEGHALRLAMIEQQLRQLGERPPATDARVPELAGRVGAAEQAMRRLDDISARLNTAEQTLRRQEEVAAKVTGVEQMNRRLEGFAARLDTVEQAHGPALAQRLTASEGTVKTLADRLAAIEAGVKSTNERLDAASVTDKALAERLAALESAMTAFGERMSDLGRRLDQVRNVARDADRQAAIATEEASRADTTDRALRTAFLAAALRNAVERGAPFASELAALKTLMPAEQTAPLEPFATTGVPSAAALARELTTVTPAMLAAVAPPQGEGLLGRLQQSTERLVRIRPINETPGDDPATVIGRIEAKAARNDIDGTIPEFAKLPEGARAAAAGWIKKAEARRAALDISGRLAHDAFSALGKAAP